VTGACNWCDAASLRGAFACIPLSQSALVVSVLVGIGIGDSHRTMIC
jgi:hypothetical protein